MWVGSTESEARWIDPSERGFKIVYAHRIHKATRYTPSEMFIGP